MNPLAFDYSPYASVTDVSHEWATDMRHIQILHAIGVLFCPLGTIVEIGSFKGASTAAFVALLRAKLAASLICVEPRPTEPLKALLDLVPAKSRIATRLADFGPTPDMVFIDGDHGKPALKDIEWALTRKIPIICLHDTNAVACGYEGCWGAVEAGRTLRAHKEYVVWEDKEPRTGERTERGFMVGSRIDTGGLAPALQQLYELMRTDAKWWL